MFTTSWRYTVTSLETIPAFRPNFQKFTFLDFPETVGFPSLSYDEVVWGRYNLTRSFETIPSFNKSPSTLKNWKYLYSTQVQCAICKKNDFKVYISSFFLVPTNPTGWFWCLMILVPDHGNVSLLMSLKVPSATAPCLFVHWNVHVASVRPQPIKSNISSPHRLHCFGRVILGFICFMVFFGVFQGLGL